MSTAVRGKGPLGGAPPRYLSTHAAVFIMLLVALLACRAPESGRGPIVIRGELTGVYKHGPPGSCGNGDTTVAGAYGPDRTQQLADLTVSDSGSVSLVTRDGRTFAGTGVAFRPPAGWDLDAKLAGPGDRHVTIKGHLPC